MRTHDIRSELARKKQPNTSPNRRINQNFLRVECSGSAGNAAEDGILVFKGGCERGGGGEVDGDGGDGVGGWRGWWGVGGVGTGEGCDAKLGIFEEGEDYSGSDVSTRLIDKVVRICGC